MSKITLYGSNEPYRASKVIKILERDYPTEFLKVTKDEDLITSDSKNMNSVEVLSMIIEANLKAKKALTINRHLKASTGEIVTRKEDSVRQVVKHMDTTDLIAFGNK